VYGDGSGLNVSAVDQALSADTWYHLAVSYDFSTGNVEWYLDGSNVKSTTLSNTPNTNGDPLWLGVHFQSNGSPDNATNGLLDELRIYDGIKSASFINRLYNEGSPSS